MYNSKTDYTTKFVLEVSWLFTMQCIIQNMHALTHRQQVKSAISSRFSPITILKIFAQQTNCHVSYSLKLDLSA
jgi:hypothetical protein